MMTVMKCEPASPLPLCNHIYAAAVTLFARMKREISSSFVVPIKFYLMMMTIRPLQQGMRFFPNGRQFLLWGVGCFPPSASLSLSGPALLRIDINELLKLQRSSRLDTHTGQIIYQLKSVISL